MHGGVFTATLVSRTLVTSHEAARTFDGVRVVEFEMPSLAERLEFNDSDPL